MSENNVNVSDVNANNANVNNANTGNANANNANANNVNAGNANANNVNAGNVNVNNANEIRMNQDQLAEISLMLRDIMENEKKEMKYAKRQSCFSVIISLACLAIVIVLAASILPMVPKVNNLIDSANDIMEQTSGIIVEAESAVTNLNTVSESLAKTDLEGMLKGVDELVEESKESISDAMVKIEAIDIEGLNQAIEDLGAVVAPLAKLLGR